MTRLLGVAFGAALRPYDRRAKLADLWVGDRCALAHQGSRPNDV